MADWLTLQDLKNLVGSERVVQLFDDDGDGTVDEADDNVQTALKAAESEAYSRLRRSWTFDSVVTLAGADPGFVMHCAWVALEFAAERRPAFCADDGKGAYWAQYERAIAFFEAISKGRQRSVGETEAGTPKQVGGNLRPTDAAKQADSFVFAPSNANPRGSGGF